MAEGDFARAQPRNRPLAAAIILLAAAMFVATGVWFATVQNVWVDETTQLLGSRLPLGRMIAWLAGAPEPLGVPNDRMPPLSYVVDWAWSSAGFRSDLAFRLLHLGIALAGVLVILRLVGRRYGVVALLVAGALLVGPPQMTGLGVEIRAYPLFFTVTAAQVALFYRLFETPALERGRLALFTAASVVGLYTHFFGLVSACAFTAGLIVAWVRSRADAGKVTVHLAVVLVASVGMMPFVFAASATSSTAPAIAGLSAAGIVTFLLRLVTHSSMMLIAPLAILYGASLTALLVMAARRALRTGPETRRFGPELGLMIALATGLAATIAAAAVVHGFNPLKPSYSVWTWPPLVVLAASAAAPDVARGWRTAARVACAVLFAALAAIQLRFLGHAAWFVHGPERALVAAVRSDPAETAIVYDGQEWAFAYFPLVYRFGLSFPQYVRDRGGMLHRPSAWGNVDTPALAPSVLERYRHVVVANVGLRTYQDLRPLLHDEQRELTFADVQPPPTSGTGWRAAESRSLPGLYSLRLTSFTRVDRP